MTKEELIKNLKYTMKKHEHDKVDTFGTNISLMCKDVLDYLEQEPKWIPVSERLPKDGGDYLVTIAFDIGDKEPVREVKKDYFCILSKKWLYEDENIIAWMPSPEPYKAESEDH